ncbi:MAG TPA: hypothetical protein VGX24_05625 [Pyrinomonadaceae bacterium]|jgi:hypothetical protein|nr:hypothetical protein [Pyrinomonadaceae bacterium]
MKGKVQRQKHQRPTAAVKRRQALLVRAVVGSLVLCAALAPHALAQGQSSPAYQQQTPETKEFRPINARPFRDLLTKTQGLIAAGELNPQDVFDFTLEAERNPDGTLRDIKFTEAAAANGRWRPLASEFVAALSDSGALSGLTGADHLTITLRLDERASARLHAVVNSAEQAAQLARNYNALIALGRLDRRGREGVEILNNMAFSANGKQLTMQLVMTREQAGNLLRQHTSLP